MSDGFFHTTPKLQLPAAHGSSRTGDRRREATWRLGNAGKWMNLPASVYKS